MAYIGRSVDIGMFEKQVLTPDSSTTTFTLTYAVGSANSLLVVYGGVVQEPQVAYSVSGGGQSIAFSEAPATGTTTYIIYLGKQLTTPRAAGQETTKQTFAGDGTTVTFTLTDPPVVPAGIMTFVDGILQREGAGNNYTSSGSTITFSTAPDNGAEIDVYTLVKEKVSIDTVADGSITVTKLAASHPTWNSAGDFTFPLTGSRIKGDFSNATVANRVAFQTSTTNSNTGLVVLPNGTSTTSNIQFYNNSDSTNASGFQIANLSTESTIRSLITGTGTYLPITFYTGGSERMRIDTSGNVGIGVTPSAWTSTRQGLQLGLGASLQGDKTGYTFVEIAGNSYHSASLGDTYLSTNLASKYRQIVGTHVWYNAPSGTAGTAVTYNQAMTLDANSTLLLGATAANLEAAYSVALGGSASAGNSGMHTFNGLNGNTVMRINQAFADTASRGAIYFYRSQTQVGSINVSSTATTYNTSTTSGIVGVDASTLGFNTASSERMRIDSSGNVGIGTTSPAVKLHVSSSGSNFIRSATTGTSGQETGYQIIATNSDASSNQWKIATNISADNEITTYDLTNSQTVDKYIRGASGYRALWTNGSERMRILSTGEVGIGTASPARKFVVSGSADPTVVQITNTTSGVGVDDGFQIIHYLSGETILLNRENNATRFYTNNAEKMCITAAGDVGIGTSSPGSKLYTQLSSATAYSSGVTGNGLTIYNSSATTNQYVGITLQGEPTTGNGGLATIMGTTTGSGNMDLTFSTRGSATLAERMRINSSGNVGIGTSSPAYKLEVVNAATTPAAAVFRTSGFADDNVSTVYLQDDTAWASGVGGRIAFRGLNDVGSYTSFATIRGIKENATQGNNAGAMVFKTYPNGGTLTERMRIDSSGNVLLGATSASTTPTGYIAAANQFTFRNKLINGAIQVAQRATAATNVTLNGPGYTTVDRWFSYQNGTVGVQTSQVAPSLSQFQYCLKWGRPSTNTTTGTTVIGQALETVNCIELQNTTVTLSFWAKCGANFSSSGSGIAVQMYTGTGADQSASLMVSGSWTGSATPINTSATLTTSWQRFVFTGTTGASINQAGVYFNWSPTGTAGADDNVYITGLQLERGPVVTAYENRPYGTELALCQRYYLMIADGTLIGSGYLTSGLYLDFPVRFPVTMRGTPAVSKNGTWNVSGSNGQPTISLSGPSGCSVRITATGTGQVYATLSGGSGNPSLSADIEL